MASGGKSKSAIQMESRDDAGSYRSFDSPERTSVTIDVPTTAQLGISCWLKPVVIRFQRNGQAACVGRELRILDEKLSSSFKKGKKRETATSPTATTNGKQLQQQKLPPLELIVSPHCVTDDSPMVVCFKCAQKATPSPKFVNVKRLKVADELVVDRDGCVTVKIQINCAVALKKAPHPNHIIAGQSPLKPEAHKHCPGVRLRFTVTAADIHHPIVGTTSTLEVHAGGNAQKKTGTTSGETADADDESALLPQPKRKKRALDDPHEHQAIMPLLKRPRIDCAVLKDIWTPKLREIIPTLIQRYQRRVTMASRMPLALAHLRGGDPGMITVDALASIPTRSIEAYEVLSTLLVASALRPLFHEDYKEVDSGTAHFLHSGVTDLNAELVEWYENTAAIPDQLRYIDCMGRLALYYCITKQTPQAREKVQIMNMHLAAIGEKIRAGETSIDSDRLTLRSEHSLNFITKMVRFPEQETALFEEYVAVSQRLTTMDPVYAIFLAFLLTCSIIEDPKTSQEKHRLTISNLRTLIEEAGWASVPLSQVYAPGRTFQSLFDSAFRILENSLVAADDFLQRYNPEPDVTYLVYCLAVVGVAPPPETYMVIYLTALQLLMNLKYQPPIGSMDVRPTTLLEYVKFMIDTLGNVQAMSWATPLYDRLMMHYTECLHRPSEQQQQPSWSFDGESMALILPGTPSQPPAFA